MSEDKHWTQAASKNTSFDGWMWGGSTEKITDTLSEMMDETIARMWNQGAAESYKVLLREMFEGSHIEQREDGTLLFTGMDHEFVLIYKRGPEEEGEPPWWSAS